MNTEEAITSIYDQAGWSYDSDEFSPGAGRKLHTVLLDSDLEVNFIGISRDVILVYSPIFEMSQSGDDAEKLKHMSSLVAKEFYSFPFGTSITDGFFRLELRMRLGKLDIDQMCLLLQKFLDICDFFIDEARNFNEERNGLFNHIPVNFLMN